MGTEKVKAGALTPASVTNIIQPNSIMVTSSLVVDGVLVPAGTTPPPSRVLHPMLSALHSSNQFIVYALILNSKNGKYAKIPKSPYVADIQYFLNPKKSVAHNKQRNWMKVGDAIVKAEWLCLMYGQFFGVGISLTESDPLFCIDLDAPFNPDGTLKSHTVNILNMFKGAAVEKSVSGNLHIWAAASLSLLNTLSSLRHEELKIDFFPSRQFVAITGIPFDGWNNSADSSGKDCTLALQMFLGEYFPNKNKINQGGVSEVPHGVIASPLLVQPTLVSDEVIGDLRAALLYMTAVFDGAGNLVNLADERKICIDLGYALHELDVVGEELWGEFIRTSYKYDAEFEALWDGFEAKHSTYKVVFTLAKKHGWTGCRPQIDPSSVDFGKAPLLEGASRAPKYAASTNDLRFKTIQAADFIKTPPVRWLIKGIVPKAELVMIYGESGSGKSFVVLDLAFAVAQGVLWCGRKTLQGRVVYIVAEGAGGMRSRLTAYQKRRAIDISKIPIDFIKDAPDFRLAEDYSKLANSIGSASLIIVDTLACCNSGDENNAQDMNIVISHCKHLHSLTGATILLVHHTGKDATRGARGSSTLRGAMDCMIDITRKGESRFATIAKQKDGADDISIPFSLEITQLGKDEDGETVTSCVVNYGKIQATERATRHRYGTWEKAILITIDRLGKNGIALHNDVLYDVINQIELKPNTLRDQRKSRVKQAIKGLVNKGGVVISGEWICKQGCQLPICS